MAYRKDLERNAAAMMKVKKPLKSLEKKEAVNLGKEFYKKTFSDQVRKGYTGEHNINVAEGSYRMIKGSAPKTITGKPMYGTIGE
jgi:hypothetical protein|tara:strand:- start:219 stop:473 length:255 start_codon:yes stop_codon:yes gene_type:complete